MSRGGPVDISVEGHWGWSWQTAGLEKERGGGDLCAMSVVFPLYVICSRRSVFSAGRETGGVAGQPFPRLQLKHTCHQSTPIKCSIKHWLRPRSAARLLQLLMRRLPCCHFCAFSFCFSVCLPASCLPSFSCDFVYCDFWPPFFATLSFTLSTKQVIKSVSQQVSQQFSK